MRMQHLQKDSAHICKEGYMHENLQLIHDWRKMGLGMEDKVK